MELVEKTVPKKKQKQGKGRHPKYAAYRGKHTREYNKLKRVLRSSGYPAAVVYAKKFGISPPRPPG